MGNVHERLHDLGDEGKAVAKGLGESFKEFGVGLAFMGAGIAGLAILDKKVEIAEHFGDAMKLAGTKVSEAEFPMASMTAIVGELGAKFGVMPVEEANALTAAIGAGARDAAKAQALLTAANQLAIGTNTDLKTNLSAVSGVIRAFNLDLKDSVAIGDAMFVASTHVEDGIAGMSTMLTVLAPAAAQANMTSNELLASIAQMSAAGIEGRHGMMGLREIIMSMIKPSEEAKAAALNLGLSFNAATLQSSGVPGILQDITNKGGANIKTLEKLFGSTEAATVAMGLMRDGGGQLKKMMDDVTNSTGAAAAAAAALVSEQKRFESVKATLDGMIGETLLPMKKAFYSLGTSILEGFTQGNPALVHFFTWMAYGASILAVVLGAGIAIIASWSVISGVFGALSTAAGVMGGAISAAFWPVLLGAALVGLAIWGMKIAFDNNFGGIADTVHRVWDDIKLTFTALVELFSGGGFTENTWQKLEKHSGIRDFAINVFGWVERIKNFFSGIGKGFTMAVKALEPVLDALGVAIDGLVDAFGMLFGSNGVGGAAAAFDSAGDAGTTFGVTLGAVFGFLAMGLQIIVAAIQIVISAVVGVIEFFKSGFSGIVDIFYGAAEMIDGIVHGDWAKVWHGLKMVAFGVIDGIIGMVLSLVSAIAGAVDALGGLVGKNFGAQKSVLDFKDFTHNELAKSMGVADGTGLRDIHDETPTGASGDQSAVPANASPWAGSGALGGGGLPAMPGVAASAAGEGVGGKPPDLGEMSTHLAQISKNTEGGGAPINVTVMLDSEVIGKAVAKAKRNDEARSFTPPALMPGW